MTLSGKLNLSAYVLIMVGLVFFAIYAVTRQRAYEKRITELQNAAADKDKTIELKDGLYHKLTLQLTDLRSLLDTKDKQMGELSSELKKRKEELLTTNTVVVGLRKEIAQLQADTQTHVPGVDGKTDREKVDFHHDFGVVKVDGWTMTNPPQSWVRLGPGRPLKISLSLSQGEDKAWHTYTTVDDPNFGVDISLTAVNPQIFKPKWYEGFGVMVGLGVGTNQSGLGALVSVGLNYKLRQFTFGPAVWLGLNDVVDKYYGITFEWRPFEKVR